MTALMGALAPTRIAQGRGRLQQGCRDCVQKCVGPRPIFDPLLPSPVDSLACSVGEICLKRAVTLRRHLVALPFSADRGVCLTRFKISNSFVLCLFYSPPTMQIGKALINDDARWPAFAMDSGSPCQESVMTGTLDNNED